MKNQIIKKTRSICLWLIVIIVVLSNFYNYFINYKMLSDTKLQWRLAMISISVVLFLFSFRVWLGESLKRYNQFYIILSGWLTLYLLVNMIGVIAGFTLHTKSFMMILFSVVFFGFIHALIKLWQNYYL